MMPAVEFAFRTFKAIITDPKWLPFLVFRDNKTTWIDLQKYSDHKSYLPIDGSYVDGFIAVQKLYEHKYRTEQNLVRIDCNKVEL